MKEIILFFIKGLLKTILALVLLPFICILSVIEVFIMLGGRKNKPLFVKIVDKILLL